MPTDETRPLYRPVDGSLTSGFGPRRRPRTRAGQGSANHQGADYGVPEGTPVLAADEGEVVFAGQASGYGNQVRLRHPDGSETTYSHLSSLGVKPGERITASSRLGLSGQTGNVSGPHLHFEYYGPDGKPADPEQRFGTRRPGGSRGPSRGTQPEPEVRTRPDGSRYVVVASSSLEPGDTPESLTAQGYRFDAGAGVWARDLTWSAPENLGPAYSERAAVRENVVLDREEQEVVFASMLPLPEPFDPEQGPRPEADNALLKFAAGIADAPMLQDIGKGLFQEGGQAVVSGLKRGVNSTFDMADEMGDWLDENVMPGTVMFNGFGGDKPVFEMITQDEAIRRSEGRDTLESQITGEPTKKPSWLQNLLTNNLRLPTNEEERPKTVTGKVIEGISQFYVGWRSGGQVLRGWQTATRAQRIGKAMAQGALADFTAFDGNQERLSNLLRDNAPEAVAPMFEWLAANEDDPELWGRFKNAIEGSILGLAADAILAGARQLKAARRARIEARQQAAREGLQVPPDLPEAQAVRAGEALEAEMKASLGNPKGARVKPAEVTGATTEPNSFDINLARIQTPEDVQAVIVSMAEKFKGDVDLARRAQRSWDQTREAAEGVDWVASMAARRPGDAVNAETALAYRQALNSSATQLLDLARKVEANPTVAAQMAFRRAAAAHHGIQLELMGARAEAGRALNAFAIPAGTPAATLRRVDDLIADAGGANTAKELARKILDAAEKGDVALNQVIRGGALARSREVVKLVYTNGLLSGIGTPAVNMVGNSMMLGLAVARRWAQPRIAGMFGGDAVTQAGEATALVMGYQQALRDMFRLNPLEAAKRIADNGGEALRREGVFRGMAPGVDDAAASAGISLRAEREEAGALAGVRQRPLSAAAWSVAEDTPLGRALDIIQMLVEAPSNLNALGDDFFKTISARGEIAAQAFRRVTAEGLTGDAARSRMADLLDNPTDDMIEAAEREMHDLTFTRQTPGMAKAFSDLRRFMDENPTPLPFGTMTLPFLRTPANLISMGMRYSPLAPLMRRARDGLAAGGEAAEIIKAEMAIGTALWSVWIGMAMDGQISGRGPSDRAQRDAMTRADETGAVGWQPYSVKFGDRWYSFERADPLGMSLTLIADYAELARNDDWTLANDEGLDEVMAHGISSIGKAFFDKTMLRSAVELTTAMVSGRTADAENLLEQRASGMIPGSGALRMTRRAVDPHLRETAGVVEAMRNTVPGLSDDLPPQRDLWGRVRRYSADGPVDDVAAVLGLQTKPVGGTAIDAEILAQGITVSMPQRSITFGGERISLKNRPDIYSEMVRLAGEPAYEHLNAVASGEHEDSEFYFGLTDGPDGGKAEYIKDVIKSYREDATALVSEMYANDLQGMVAARERRRREVRVGGE